MIVKALALGAFAVGIGRPYAWGWPWAAPTTPSTSVRLLAETDLTMAVDDYQSLKDLTPDALRPAPIRQARRRDDPLLGDRDRVMTFRPRRSRRLRFGGALS